MDNLQMDVKNIALVKYWYKNGLDIVQLANKYHITIEQVEEIIDGKKMPLFDYNEDIDKLNEIFNT